MSTAINHCSAEQDHGSPARQKEEISCAGKEMIPAAVKIYRQLLLHLLDIALLGLWQHLMALHHPNTLQSLTLTGLFDINGNSG